MCVDAHKTGLFQYHVEHFSVLCDIQPRGEISRLARKNEKLNKLR
jgi:hypothetical protein